MTPQQRATASAAALWAGDQASQWLGCALVSVGPGQAQVQMPLQAHHLNGHGICHGGFIFTLADSAFAFACNSYNRRVVAQTNTITYLAPGQAGSTLTATATEVSLTGRSGIYDVTVTDQSGTRIALFRGQCRQISGQHFPEDSSETEHDHA